MKEELLFFEKGLIIKLINGKLLNEKFKISQNSDL